MTVILDSGGLSALVNDPLRVKAMRQLGFWPPVLPAVVLVESLTGDYRRDFHVNRLLAGCLIEEVDQNVCRLASLLRTKTGRVGTMTAVDAVVVAMAASLVSPVVITSDPRDISDLAEQLENPIVVSKA